MGETQRAERMREHLPGRGNSVAHFVRLPLTPSPADVTLTVKDMGSETRFGPYHYSVFRPHCRAVLHSPMILDMTGGVPIEFLFYAHLASSCR